MKIFAGLFVCCTFIFAKTSYGITLQQCVDAAKKNSPLIASLTEKIEAGNYAYKKDKGALYLKFEINDTHDFTNNGGIASAIVTLEMQKILTNFPRAAYSASRRNEIARDIAKLELEKTVTLNYYSLYTLLQKKKDYAAAKEYFSGHIKDIENLGTAGVDVKLDLERAEIKYGSLLLTENVINKEINDLLIDLSSLTGGTFTEEDFSLMEVPEVRTEKSYFENRKNVIAGLFPETVQYRAGALDLDIAEGLYRQTALAYLPSLGFQFNRVYNKLPGGDDYNFITFNWTFFDGLRLRNENRRLYSEYKAQKNLFEENLRALKARINHLINGLETAQEGYKTVLKNFEAAEDLIKLSLPQYRMGKIRETDLLDIFSSYLDAKQQYYDILNDYLNKEAELAFITAGIKK